MTIRLNETDRYLINTWHFIVFYEGDELKQTDFTASKTGRVGLYNEINRLIENGSEIIRQTLGKMIKR